jgi:hypothetical protein
MLHDQHRMVGRSKCFPFGFRQRFERMRDYRNGESAAFL